MMLINRFSISIILMVTLHMGQTAWAATYYVDRSLPGKDSNAGTTEATAFLTIAKCVAVAINPSDTCLVKNGNYPEPWRITHSGASGQPITISNYPGHSPTITMSGRSDGSNQLLFASTDSYTTPIGWIVIQGFIVSNAYTAFNCSNCHDVIYRRNIVHDMYMGAFGGNGTRITIDRNIMYHNGRFAECVTTPSICNKDQQIYYSGTYFTITNNLIYDGLSNGIQVAGYPYDSSSSAGPEYTGASNWLIANNTIAYQNYGAGIVVWQPAAVNNTIENNIIYENTQSGSAGDIQGVYFYHSGGGNVVRNNIIYGTAPGALTGIGDTAGGASYTASGNSINVSNPNMVNAPSTVPSVPNFSLQASSPAIDKGLTQSLVTVDYNGIPRPQGSAFDIGAYEGAVQSDEAPTAPQGLKVF